MNTATILRGDAVTMLRTIPDASVHCCVTSPPYYGLRDYGTATWEGGDPECDHKQGRNGAGRADGIIDDRGQRNRDGVGSMGGNCRKCGAIRIDQQIGLEDTPSEYVDRLVAVFREVRRVLRDDGVCWLNLGDSYNSNASNQNGTSNEMMRPSRQGAFVSQGRKNKQWSNLKPKDLLGIPWRVAFALQDDGWWLRQDVIWHKPNPMPESVTDRCTKAHEYVFLLTKSARYFYDAQAVAEASIYPDDNRKARSTPEQKRMPTNEIAGVRPGSATYATRNKRSVWTIATEPTPYAHFATMPTELAETCILAGCPGQVCSICGAPWVRVVEKIPYTPPLAKDGERNVDASRGDKNRRLSGKEYNAQSSVTTIGFAPSCECNAGTVPGTVLDPFAGSGTTLRVALTLGRNAIGIELNPEYAALAEQLIAQTQPALLPL